ncbi:MAG TPA: hydrogenase expression/formation protein HypE [Clostridiales bacterium]|nr:hydrogenase expression/formation protein HypE [Clostridiales bacterium]
MKITLAHGSGGKATSELIHEIFANRFNNPVLAKMEDSAVVPGAETIAMTTDSFVVTPVFFPGGNIGRLSVCGTVNDLLMNGAEPKYLTCGFIIEEGADSEALACIADSMAETAREAGVSLVAGDTKVIDGKGGVYINTAGVGFVPRGRVVSASQCETGDVVLLSGYLGEHHAAILSSRMGIENQIQSDCAPLNEIVNALFRAGVRVKAMRDVTRGGLATVLNEFAQSSGCCIELEEDRLPVSQAVKGFCGILGLDPLYMGNEGKLVAVVEREDAEKALQAMRSAQYGANAAQIGSVISGQTGTVLVKTGIGGTRIVTELYGEGLPRIC